MSILDIIMMKVEAYGIYSDTLWGNVILSSDGEKIEISWKDKIYPDDKIVYSKIFDIPHTKKELKAFCDDFIFNIYKKENDNE